MDLLGMAGHRPCLPMVVCVNTRDELDAICYALSNLSYLSTTPLVLSLSIFHQLFQVIIVMYVVYNGFIYPIYQPIHATHCCNIGIIVSNDSTATSKL